MVGLLAFLVSVEPATAAFTVTGMLVIAGVVQRTTSRGRKVTTAVASAADEYLDAAQGTDQRRAARTLLRAGMSGLDTGLATGWWGVPVLAACEEADLRAYLTGDVDALPEDLVPQLRERMARWLDVAA